MPDSYFEFEVEDLITLKIYGDASQNIDEIKEKIQSIKGLDI